MNPKRFYFVLIATIALLIVLCGVGTYFAKGILEKQGQELQAVKLEEAVLARQQKALAQAKKDIAQYEELEKITRSVVPQEKDQATTVRELVAIAEESKINIASIEFPESKLGEVIKKSKSSSSSSKQEKTVDSNTTQLTEVEGLKGVYAMEIKVTSDNERPVSYSQLLAFLQRLEKNRRTAQVVDISIQPSEDNRSLVTFSITLNTYVRP
jgi:hypothetical protein